MSILEQIEKLNYSSRYVVMSDLAKIMHGYTIKESFDLYRKIVNKLADGELKSFCEHRIDYLINILGHKAIRPLYEDKDDEDTDTDTDPLSRAIDSKGDDQSEAADVLDVHKSTVSRWKTGSRKPSFDALQKLKKTYGSGVVDRMLSA